MGVYLHAKFEVYSIVLTSLIQEEGVVLPPSASPPPPQKEALKSPPRLGLKKQLIGANINHIQKYMRKTNI